MKIIQKDNFNRDEVSDVLVADNIQHAAFANCMCEALQKKFGGNDSTAYFEVKPDDYELYRFIP